MIFENHELKEDNFHQYIEAIFYMKAYMPPHKIERVVPTGHIFIIFELDGIVRNTFDNESLKPKAFFKDVWLSGMHKNHLSISAHEQSEMLVIQFKSFGALPFIGEPIHHFNDKVIPAHEIFGAEIIQLRNNLQSLSEIVEKFQAVDKWLESRYLEKYVPTNNLLEFLHKLINQPIHKHNELIENYPRTQKHLINQFKKYCGLTPKVLHRIFRFNSLLQHIQHRSQIKWSDIAYEFGYSDQSHFIKEFKSFSGFNPQEFIENDHHERVTNFFPLDKKG